MSDEDIRLACLRLAFQWADAGLLHDEEIKPEVKSAKLIAAAAEFAVFVFEGA